MLSWSIPNANEFKGKKCFCRRKIIELYNTGAFPEWLEVVGVTRSADYQKVRTKYLNAGKDNSGAGANL
jgi:hypothetical protein